MKSLFILLFLSYSLTSVASGSDSTSAKQKIPSVILKNTNGVSIDVSTYGTNGKITVISFWATWCKPCIKELRNINELLEEWEELYNVELVAISMDDSRNVPRVKPFASGQGWNFDILLDPNGDLQRDLNVANPPATFLVDLSGNIVYTHIGYLEGDEFDLEDEIKKLAGVTSKKKK
jgi:cytochrome c biogenesis protein CcmG, thiol:disulfide interchange protein DsbE